MSQASGSDDPAGLLFQGALEGTLDAAPLRGRFDLDQGLALQLAVLERWREQGERLGGYKVGFTSGSSRDAFGPGFRPFGYILGSRILASGSRLERVRLGRGGLEPELCFRVGAPLHGAVTPGEARAAVLAVSPAFEINQLRLTGAADPALRLADNLSQWGIVVGREQALSGDLRGLQVEVRQDGELRAEVDRSYRIDDHFESIAALAATLARFGQGIEPGQRIITGAYSRHELVEPGRWEACFTGIGRVELELA